MMLKGGSNSHRDVEGNFIHEAF